MNMVQAVQKGDFAHVVGTFDLQQATGTIDYVTPVRVAADSVDVEDEGIHLVGENADHVRLFNKVVNPQRNSCAPQAKRGTFEEFVPVSPDLRTIKLMIADSVAAEFKRGDMAAAAGRIALGPASAETPHHLALSSAVAVAPTPGVTYVVQAKAENSDQWQTLAVGLPTPSAEVNVNQFPGAAKVDVRVLRSDGFSEAEVFRDTRTF